MPSVTLTVISMLCLIPQSDYQKGDSALAKTDQIAYKADGRTFMRRSTKGWKLCVQWKDGSTSWEKLSDMKESHPIPCAEYAVSQDIADEPAAP